MAATSEEKLTVSLHGRRCWRQRGEPDQDPVAAWHEAVKVHYPSARDGASARYHLSTDTILLTKERELVTVIDVGDRPPGEREYIREQVQERDNS